MYSTKSDILAQTSDEELKQLTSEDGSTVDDTIVNKCIADADSLIDGYLSSKYSVPLVTVPALVNKFSVSIALHNLYSRRPALAMNETIRQNYEDAVEYLEKVAKGDVGIGIDPPPIQPSTAKPFSTSSGRDFTKESMRGW
jgi:phage gp36-like protein